MSWTAATDNVAVTGYRLDVSTQSSFASFIAGYSNQDLGSTTSTALGGLVPSTTYYARLRAYDAAANVSGNSATASATTLAAPDTTPPSAPANLAATALSTGSITLAWTAATDNVAVTGYRLDVSTQSSFARFITGYSNQDLGSVTSTALGGLVPSTTYYARVRAYDTASNPSANSAWASAMTLAQDGVPPTVAITAPDDGAMVLGAIIITATASDNVGVSKIEFYIDGLLRISIAIVTAGPYSYTVDTTQLSNASHTVLFKAYDAAGNNAAAAIHITVNNPQTSDLTPPTVAITSPQANATVKSKITATITGSDNVAVQKVELLIDGAAGASQIFSTPTPSFTINLSFLAGSLGGHTLTARAYDTTSNASISYPVPITVVKARTSVRLVSGTQADILPGQLSDDAQDNARGLVLSRSNSSQILAFDPDIVEAKIMDTHGRVLATQSGSPLFITLQGGGGQNLPMTAGLWLIEMKDDQGRIKVRPMIVVK